MQEEKTLRKLFNKFLKEMQDEYFKITNYYCVNGVNTNVEEMNKALEKLDNKLLTRLKKLPQRILTEVTGYGYNLGMYAASYKLKNLANYIFQNEEARKQCDVNGENMYRIARYKSLQLKLERKDEKVSTLFNKIENYCDKQYNDIHDIMGLSIDKNDADNLEGVKKQLYLGKLMNLDNHVLNILKNLPDDVFVKLAKYHSWDRNCISWSLRSVLWCYNLKNSANFINERMELIKQKNEIGIKNKRK